MIFQKNIYRIRRIPFDSISPSLVRVPLVGGCTKLKLVGGTQKKF